MGHHPTSLPSLHVAPSRLETVPYQQGRPPVWRACPKHRFEKTPCPRPLPHYLPRHLDGPNARPKYVENYPHARRGPLRKRKTPRVSTACSWSPEWEAKCDKRMGNVPEEPTRIKQERAPSPAGWRVRPKKDDPPLYDSISVAPDFPPPHILPGKRHSKRLGGAPAIRKRSRSAEGALDNSARKRRMPRAGSISITPPPGAPEQPEPAPRRVLREKRQGRAVYRHETDIDSGADPTLYGPRLTEEEEDSASEYAPDSDGNERDADEEEEEEEEEDEFSSSPFEEYPDEEDEEDLYSLPTAAPPRRAAAPTTPVTFSERGSSRAPASPSTQLRSEEEQSRATVVPPTPQETPSVDSPARVPVRETVYISSSPSRSPSPARLPAVEARVRKRAGCAEDNAAETRGPGRTRWGNPDCARWRDPEKARGRFSGPRRYTPLVTVGDGKRPWEVVGEGVRLGEEVRSKRRRRDPSPEL